MSKIECDIAKFADFESDFNNVVKQYVDNINDVFDIIEKLPDKAWRGNDAFNYIALKKKEKLEIDKFNESLFNYANSLTTMKAELTNLISSLER